MEQQTGSKLGKQYVKAVSCHPAYLTSMHIAFSAAHTRDPQKVAIGFQVLIGSVKLCLRQLPLEVGLGCGLDLSSPQQGLASRDWVHGCMSGPKCVLLGNEVCLWTWHVDMTASNKATETA